MKLQESTTGFYYVGTKRANITKLVNIYQRGYASGNLNQAMNELIKKEGFEPEVICCESEYGFAAIKRWSGLLSKDKRFSQVPLIIDAGRKTAAAKFNFILNNAVDDILNLQEWDENNLNTKIRFLRKFKSRTGTWGKKFI
jgi:hypothetical protein